MFVLELIVANANSYHSGFSATRSPSLSFALSVPSGSVSPQLSNLSTIHTVHTRIQASKATQVSGLWASMLVLVRPLRHDTELFSNG